GERDLGKRRVLAAPAGAAPTLALSLVFLSFVVAIVTHLVRPGTPSRCPQRWLPPYPAAALIAPRCGALRRACRSRGPVCRDAGARSEESAARIPTHDDHSVGSDRTRPR